MAKEMIMAGCAAAAHAAKFARVEVISSYPIRPYTGIMMELSKLVANGELDAEFITERGNMPRYPSPTEPLPAGQGRTRAVPVSA